MSHRLVGIVGVPGSGKTWCTNQLKDKFHLVHHDGYIGHINQPEAYVDAILEAVEHADKPILIEMPFSMSQILEPLEALGHKVHLSFIIEDPDTLSRRYLDDRKKEIPKGHLTRMKTYADRARGMGAFAGNSSQVLKYLKDL